MVRKFGTVDHDSLVAEPLTYLRHLKITCLDCNFHLLFFHRGVLFRFIVVDYNMALQDDHIESDEELPKKTKSYFANAAETFDAEFYSKVNDDIYINVGKYQSLAFHGFVGGLWFLLHLYIFWDK